MPSADGEAVVGGADKVRATLLNNLAACKLKQRKHSEVTSLCTRSLAIEPANSKALFRRGMAHKRLGNFAQALADFREGTFVPSTWLRLCFSNLRIG